MRFCIEGAASSSRTHAVMPPVLESEDELIARLRAGDESAFTCLVGKHGSMMMRLAQRYVQDTAAAEEVVQETWLAVLQGLGSFAGRSSLKSWIFAILVKRAMTRGKRDARQIPFSSLARAELENDDPAVSADRFEGPDGAWPRHWRDDAMPASASPDAALLESETQAYILNALQTLPRAQRAVVELRDITGADVAEIAQLLELSDGNVRVLLHRGRAKLRSALEYYLVGHIQ